ncbi:MAG: hypothetical protein L0Z62_15495 [Gemmataceae bacterium]|nr:hypothetical protein [Gemmataceae bacterium]
MKRFTLAVLVALGLVPSLTPARAWGQVILPQQQFSPFRRPTFSPYLNLLRGGSPTVNYFGQVLPQINQARQLQGQQFQLQQLQQQQGQLQAGALGPGVDAGGLGGVSVTGHPVAFWNYGRYYPGFTGRFTGSGGAASTPLLSTPLLNTPLATPFATTGPGLIIRR